MLLVIALPDCALRLSKVLTRAHYVVAVRDASELLLRVHEHQPDVVVLDWRMGGSAWRAVDEVPAIISEMTTPHVILVLPWLSAEVDREAAQMGCYDAVSLTSSVWAQETAECVAAAAADRRRHPLVVRQLSRGSLH